jgi:hypothetical protein
MRIARFLDSTMEELNGLETEEKLNRYRSEFLKCRLLIAFPVCHFFVQTEDRGGQMGCQHRCGLST